MPATRHRAIDDFGEARRPGGFPLDKHHMSVSILTGWSSVERGLWHTSPRDSRLFQDWWNDGASAARMQRTNPQEGPRAGQLQLSAGTCEIRLVSSFSYQKCQKTECTPLRKSIIDLPLAFTIGANGPRAELDALMHHNQ